MKYIIVILMSMFLMSCSTLMTSNLTDCSKACKTKTLKMFENDDLKCECK